MKINKSIKLYLAKIGSKGGKKSRRILTSEDAKKMVIARIKKNQKKDLTNKSGL